MKDINDHQMVMNDLYFDQLCVEDAAPNSITQSLDLVQISVFSNNVFKVAKQLAPDFETLNQNEVIVWRQYHTREGGLIIIPNTERFFKIKSTHTDAEAWVDNRVFGLYCSLLASDITSKQFKDNDQELFMAFLNNTVALGIGCSDLSDLYHFVDIPGDDADDYFNEEGFEIDLSNSIHALTDGDMIFKQIKLASPQQIKQSRDIGSHVQNFI